MFGRIMKGLEGSDDSEEGGFNTGHVWKLKKNLSPKVNDPPSAMTSSEGKLLTKPDEIFEEAIKHYKNSFKEREIDDQYVEYKCEREN